VILYSRRRKSFNRQFPLIVEALADLPEDTVVDGEVVALDQSGRPDFMRSVLKFSSPRVRISDYVEASATDMLNAVREHRLEGVIGKRKDSIYEPGKRSGAWIKYRVNRGQELVIGGYIPGAHGLDSIIVGYLQGR
jgi:bifunctional non-homologous end joining protein LigD